MTSFLRALRTGSTHEYDYDDKTILELEPPDIIKVAPLYGIKTTDLTKAIDAVRTVRRKKVKIYALQQLAKIKLIEKDPSIAPETKIINQQKIRDETILGLTEINNLAVKNSILATDLTNQVNSHFGRPLVSYTDEQQIYLKMNGKGRKHRTKHRRPTRRLKNRRTKRRRVR